MSQTYTSTPWKGKTKTPKFYFTQDVRVVLNICLKREKDLNLPD